VFDLPTIPTIPIPLAGGGVGQLDQDTGNVYNSTGSLLGNMNKTPSSQIPSSPAAAGTAGAGVKYPTGSPTLDSLEEWASGLVQRTPLGHWITLEDLVFIVLGLLLLAAAFFSFRQTQTVIKSSVKNVRGAIDTKAAAALAAA
jgi:hypothetical protein